MRRALNATCRTQCAEVYRPALNLASSCRELPRSKLTEGSYAHRIRSWRGGNSPAAKINPLVGPLFRGWGVELLDRDSSVSRSGCRLMSTKTRAASARRRGRKSCKNPPKHPLLFLCHARRPTELLILTQATYPRRRTRRRLASRRS